MLWNVTEPGDHTTQFVFDDNMINYQRIWLNFIFSQLIKNVLFYNPYKIC